MRTASLETRPRARASCFPPGDQVKVKIKSEVKFVNCLGAGFAGTFDRSTVCAQRLDTPFLLTI